MPCQSIQATFVSLVAPVDYEAPDEAGVDLLFVLVVPNSETHAHLDLLKELATVFNSAEHRSELRKCDSADAIMLYFERIDSALLDAKRA